MKSSEIIRVISIIIIILSIALLLFIGITFMAAVHSETKGSSPWWCPWAKAINL